MGKDPQTDNSYPCEHCDGTGKCPTNRAELEQYKREHPGDDDDFTEEDIDDCDECKGEGFIDPDDEDDHYNEEHHDDLRKGLI